MSKNDRHDDGALRMALHREQSRFHMPEGLTEGVMRRVRGEGPESESMESLHDITSLGDSRRTNLFSLFPARHLFLAIAVLLVVGFFMLAPRMKESPSLAIYEGSYVIEDGQRVDDLKEIKNDITEALSMADRAELLSRE